MKKKLTTILMVFIAVLTLVACKPDKEDLDTTAPLFQGLVDGKLEAVKHLKGEEVDFLKGIKARDDVDADEDVVITIIDKDGYSKDKVGKYTFTYSAKDTSDNESKVKRDVTVLDTLDVTLGAVVIGDDFFEYSLNDEEAFKVGSDGTSAHFRSQDVVHVMDTDFFEAQVVAHKDAYPETSNVPVLPYGSMALVDNDGKVQYARFSAGAPMEINAEGVVSHESLEWGAFFGGGGSLLFGLDEKIETLLPNGGKVVFIASVGDGTVGQLSRKFLHRNLFMSEYVGGVMYKDDQDIDITKVKVDFIADHRVVIAKPDAIDTPEITIERHVLSWDPITNSKGYEVYIDGELLDEKFINGTEVNLLEAIEKLTEEGKAPYKLKVKAISADIFKFSDSKESKVLDYKRIEIIDLEAPVIEKSGDNITWNSLEGADKYEVYVEYAGTSILLDTVKETTFDIIKGSVGHEGNNNYFVKAIGKEEYSDSPISNKILAHTGHVTKELEVNGLKTEVAVVTASNYFARRNAADATKFDNMLYLVTDTFEYKGTITEAFSTVSILDKDMNAKFVRNILAKQTYSTEKGWFSDEAYAGNNAQYVEIEKYIAKDDLLLIGKNGLDVTYTNSENVEFTVPARNYLAHLLVKPKLNEDGTIAEGWRDPMSTFVDSKTVKLNFK